MPRIAYIQYTNPAVYPPLEHSSRLLADKGWTVLFLGTGLRGVESLRLAPHPNITVKQLPQCNPGWRQKLHYAWFIIWTYLKTIFSGCAWVYASDQFAGPPALLLSYLPWIQIVYHEHDSPAADGHPSRFQRIVRWTRRKLASRAVLCVLPNQDRITHFQTELGIKVPVVCVWNCPTKNEVSPPRASRNGGDLWLLYHGSIVPSRLPPTVLQALGMLPEQVKLRAIGYETLGYPGYIDELRTLATKLGIAHRVEFLGTVPTRDDLFAQCRRADIGLAFMPKTSRDINERAMAGASNKPFDFLACGLALLVSDLPDWRELYIENNLALPVDPQDAESIAAAVRWLAEHPAELRTMGERGRNRILSEWNYENQFTPVFDVVMGKLS